MIAATSFTEFCAVGFDAAADVSCGVCPNAVPHANPHASALVINSLVINSLVITPPRPKFCLCSIR